MERARGPLGGAPARRRGVTEPRGRTVATFVTDGAIPDAGPVTLGEDAAHHMRVRRLAEGGAVALRDGAGRSADATLVRLARAQATVEVVRVHTHAPPPPVHLLVPVADRDRMLWLGEKVVEIGVASWRPVLWHRSRSVTPRGEGPAFATKLRARMASALAQSEAAWLPVLHAEATLDAAVEAVIADRASSLRLLLDPPGEPLATMRPTEPGAPVVVACGPEGGIEPDEHARLVAAGFRAASLPGNILRFETAGVLGAAFARAMVEARPAEPPSR